MNYLRLFLATTTLVLALTISAFAGQMDTTVMSPQPPPPPTTCKVDCSSVSADSVTEVALTLVQSVLALF